MAIIVITIFASCQKDETVPSSNVEYPEFIQEAPESVQVDLSKDEHGEPVLSFKTEADMNTQVQNLKVMSETDSEQWYDQFDGYLSQNQFKWNIVDEFNNAQSMEEVKLIRSRSANLLIYNNKLADEDMSPYIPSSHLGNDLVCNKYGNVMISGKIHNFNDIASYSERESPLTKSRSEVGNGIYRERGKSRLMVRAYYNSATYGIDLWLEAQNKTWFGWMWHKTQYSLRFEEFWGWNEAYSLGWEIFITAKPYYHVTPVIKAGDYHPLVRGLTPGAYRAKFVLRVNSSSLPCEDPLTVVWP